MRQKSFLKLDFTEPFLFLFEALISKLNGPSNLTWPKTIPDRVK